MYRRLEFLLGDKSASMLVPHRGTPSVHAELEKALTEPSLYDEVLRLLARRGYAVPAEVLDRDPTRATSRTPRSRRSGRALRRRDQDTDLMRLGEALTDVAELVWRWRNDHLVATRRAMGAKTGHRRLRGGGLAGEARHEERLPRAVDGAQPCLSAPPPRRPSLPPPSPPPRRSPAGRPRWTPPTRWPPSATASCSTSTVYLDGNSLGALSTGVLPRLSDVVAREWGELRIRSWDESGWWTAPERIGDRIAPLVGAAPGQIVVGDSTSVNVFKALVAAVRMAPPERDEILVDAATFPTDGYIAAVRGPDDRPHGAAPCPPDEIAAAADGRTAVGAGQPRRLPHRPAARPARRDRRAARGRRPRGLGPVPQRGRAAGRTGRGTAWTSRSAAPTST